MRKEINMKRCRILLGLISMVAVFLSATSISATVIEDRTLVILHTNDFHGHPLEFSYNQAPGAGGLPAIATFVAQFRAKHKNVLLLDAGDLNTGAHESNFFKAVPDIVGLNYIGYDAMALGNHEFDHPISILKKQERLANFPFLSANVKTKGGASLVRPYTIKRFSNFTVGIFGLTLKETEMIGNPEHVRDLVIEDEVKSAQKMVKALRGKVDILIALVHMGIWDDNARGSRRLAASVKGIDLIIDGHTHTDLTEPLYVNSIPIVQAWKWGLKVGQGIMKLGQGKVSSFEWKSVPINLKQKIRREDGTEDFICLGEKYKEDEFLLSALTPFAAQVESMLSEVVGVAGSPFNNENGRKQETALGDLIADAMLWQTRHLNVDFAIQNGGGIRADLPEGPITRRRIYDILPFDNTVVVLKMKGSQVLQLFDRIAAVPSGRGAFPQVSEGVRFTINYHNQSCENVTIGGNPVDPEKVYSIATNSYLAAGGDGYTIFLRALDHYDTSIFQRDALSEYLKTMKKKLTPEINRRIEISVHETGAGLLMRMAA
jgi:5'-nucleotidase/UDP-sugar diphosphatase